MGTELDGIDDRLAAWLEAQPVFFVATAPAEGGHVNLSPKGLDSLRVLGPREVAYSDLTGSGAETIAHLRDDGRICLAFCAFEGPPRIVRLQGAGEAVLPGDSRWSALAARLPDHLGRRAIVRVDVARVASSCGYAVPLMTFEARRDVLDQWSERKGAEGLAAYRVERNAESIDGLPAYFSG